MTARAPIARSTALPLPAAGTRRDAAPTPRERARTGTSTAARSATRGEIVRALRDAVRGIALGLRVPGRHPSGPTYEALLTYLDEGGRDFLAVTSAARKHILATISAQYENSRTVPTHLQMRDAIRDAFKAWIMLRFEGKVRDQHFKLLTIPYARRKAKDGYGGEPIGVRTGALRDRVDDAGRVVITTA